MSDSNPENVIQRTLQSNVASFESIYEKSWDKREDLAKLLITLSSTFLVAVASFMKLFYPGNEIPKHFVWFVIGLLVPLLLACISLCILAELRSLKVAAFEKRHKSKGVFDACFAGEEPTIVPFEELVLAVLQPARNRHRWVGRILAAGYASLFLSLLFLGVGLVYCP